MAIGKKWDDLNTKYNIAFVARIKERSDVSGKFKILPDYCQSVITFSRLRKKVPKADEGGLKIRQTLNGDLRFIKILI